MTASDFARDLAHALDPAVCANRKISSPASFAHHASRGHWALAPHLDLIDRALVQVAAGREARLMVLAPPRHGKSELISHYFPAWFLGRYPDRRVILCSHEAGFASSWGRKVRDALGEYGPELFGVEVRSDASAASEFEISRHRGGMITAGAGGPITGRGADLLIIDDPVKNHEDAQSKALRSRIWDWWRSTARTRLEPGAGVVLMMTRWHEDDLAGRLLAESSGDGERWSVLRLPALAEEEGPDPLGRAPGEALWPERYPVQELAETRKALGSAVFSALFQGLPHPATGSVFHREWFKGFKVLSGGGFDLGGRVVAVSGCQRFATVDLAVSTKTSADFTVIATFARTPQRELLVLDIERVHMEAPDLVGLLSRSYDRWHHTFIGVERSGFQLSIIQAARREGLPIRELTPDSDKVSRAIPAAARMESGDVYLLDGAHWREDFEHELLAFPTGAHDDMVDCLSYAVTHLNAYSPATIQSPAGYILPPITPRRPYR